MKLNCIFARDLNGKMSAEDGKLPWKAEPFASNPEIAEFAKKDMAHFKEVTSGNIVVMGFNTFLAFEKPLPNRWNIVIDRNCGKKKPGNAEIEIQKLGETNRENPGKSNHPLASILPLNQWIFFSSIEECLEKLGILSKKIESDGLPFPEVYLIGGKKIIQYCKEKNLLNGKIDETVYPWVL